MLKKRYGNRLDWKRVLERDYKQLLLDTAEFRGYVTLLSTRKVSAPLLVLNNEKSLCILDDGYSWLQHFPEGERFSLTTMFNAEGEILQWYIDVCKEIGIEDGVPWMEDLYLDIVVLPSGEIILKDEDELEEALVTGIIDQALYDMAWEEAKRIMDLIDRGEFGLLELSKKHMKLFG